MDEFKNSLFFFYYLEQLYEKINLKSLKKVWKYAYIYRDIKVAVILCEKDQQEEGRGRREDGGG